MKQQPAPKPKIRLSANARTHLREAIRKHPRASTFVSSASEISNLRKDELIDLALKLGINVPEVIVKNDPRFSSSGEPHPFSGVIDFPIEMSMLGEKVERMARLHYQHTPAWAFFDFATKTEKTGDEAWVTRLEVRAEYDSPIHCKQERDGDRRQRLASKWEVCTDLTAPGIWSAPMWIKIDGMIDEECRRTDAHNRSMARTSAE